MYQDFPKDRPSVPFELEPSETQTPPPASRPWLKALAIALLVGLLALAGLRLFGADRAQADAPPPPTVTVATPVAREIVEWDDYTGQFEASQSVEVRPRVSGQLVGIHFRDGDFVRRGQLLFTIDPRPYEAALAEARGRLAAAQSALGLARIDYSRAERLIDSEAVSQAQVDTRRAAMTSRAADVAAAQAVVRQRELDLQFTRVTAPIAGRVSDRRIDVGNLVAANELMLTTLVALDPIHFSFDGSEALALRAQRQRRNGEAAAAEVEIRLQDESGYNWRGRVDFTDNAIDPGSGTLRGRAVVANPDNFLTPGMFGSMRLSSGAPRRTLLIPDAAVQTDQARKIVLVVDRNGTVGVRPVELGARIGTLRSIRSGLRPDDRVIVEGVQFARPGTQVNVRATRIEVPSAPAATAGAPASRAPAASQATLAG